MVCAPAPGSLGQPGVLDRDLRGPAEDAELHLTVGREVDGPPWWLVLGSRSGGHPGQGQLHRVRQPQGEPVGERRGERPGEHGAPAGDDGEHPHAPSGVEQGAERRSGLAAVHSAQLLPPVDQRDEQRGRGGGLGRGAFSHSGGQPLDDQRHMLGVVGRRHRGGMRQVGERGQGARPDDIEVTGVRRQGVGEGPGDGAQGRRPPAGRAAGDAEVAVEQPPPGLLSLLAREVLDTQGQGAHRPGRPGVTGQVGDVHHVGKGRQPRRRGRSDAQGARRSTRHVHDRLEVTGAAVVLRGGATDVRARGVPTGIDSPPARDVRDADLGLRLRMACHLGGLELGEGGRRTT